MGGVDCTFPVARASAIHDSLLSHLTSRHLGISVTTVSLQAAIEDRIVHAVVRRSVTLAVSGRHFDERVG